MFHGFDHVAIHCSNLHATRELFVGKLGLQQLDFSTSENSAACVLAVGITDLEISGGRDTQEKTLGPRIVSKLGFWIDRIDQQYDALKQRGVAVGGPPGEYKVICGITRQAFSSDGFDGLPLEIVQQGA